MTKASRIFTQHAVERAFERYGLTLAYHEMLEIWRACHDGRATAMHAKEDGKVYVYRWRGVWIMPVISSDDLLVTFNPSTYFTKGNFRSLSRKTVFGANRAAENPTYKRSVFKRDGQRAAREDA